MGKVKQFGLSDLQIAAILDAEKFGTVSTMRKYGHNKSTVKALVAKGFLVRRGYSLMPRYELTPLGIEAAEWLLVLRARDEQRSK